MITAIVIFSLILIGILVTNYYSFSSRYYLEKSLYQFKESKHALIMYMGENANSLDKESFNKLKDLLHLINNTITHFTKLDSLSVSVKVVVLNTIQSDQKLESRRSQNETIEPFVKLYHKGIGYSLQAVPLLKIKIIVSFIKFVFSLLISFGYSKFKHKLNKIESFLKAEDNYNNNRCFN